MDLRTVLTTDTVNLHLKGTTKEEIIDEMIDILVKAGKVTNKAEAREVVLDRERKMSTGMKHGIAIPLEFQITRLILIHWIRSRAAYSL